MTLMSQMIKALQSKWKFLAQEAQSRIILQVGDDNVTHTMIIQVKDDIKIICMMLKYQQKAAQQCRATMIRLFNQANCDLLLGGLEMDPEDGECQYRNSIDVESLQLTDTFLETLVRRHASVGCKYWQPVQAVLNGGSYEQAYRLI
jgi:hypothetical protein